MMNATANSFVVARCFQSMRRSQAPLAAVRARGGLLYPFGESATITVSTDGTLDDDAVASWMGERRNDR